MVGVKFREGTPVGDAVNGAYAQQMLTVPAGENTMRLLPPLIIDDEQANIIAEHVLGLPK